MSRILVLSDVIDHTLSLYLFQACDSVGHVDPPLWTASHQSFGSDPANGAVLRSSQQKACGAWTYLTIIYIREVSQLSSVLLVG